MADDIAALIAAELSKAILDVATAAQRAIIAGAPSRAKRSIFLSTIARGGVTSAEVRGTGLSYIFVYGAAPHVIQTRRSRGRSFGGPKAMSWSGATHPVRGAIRHPGSPGDDFWGRGIAAVPPVATAALFAAGGRVVFGAARMVDSRFGRP